MAVQRRNRHTKKINNRDAQRVRVLSGVFGVLFCAWIGIVVPATRLQGAVSGSSTNVQLVYLAYDDDIDPPYVENLDPASGATLVPVATTIAFRIKDYKNNDGSTAGSGVSLASIVVTVTHGVTTNTYQDGDAEFSATGSAVNRLITITPASSFLQGTRIHVVVDAEDLHGPANVMSTFRYSFLTVPAPVASSSSAASAAAGGAGGSANGGDDREGGSRGAGTNVQWPRIIERRTLPNTTTIERILPWSEAREIEQCYIDGLPRLTDFADVIPGVWYEYALASLVKQGVIDGSARFFRPSHGATRAETATMLTRLAGIQTQTPIYRSFTDVALEAWYAPYVEAAAQHGWMLGYDNCYGRTVLCRMGPEQTVTRAEAAAMIVRYFALEKTGTAPSFSDVEGTAWYAPVLQIAADHCVVTGDGSSKKATPARPVTRAELVTMISRAQQDLRWERECR